MQLLCNHFSTHLILLFSNLEKVSEKQNIENLFKDRFDNFKPEVNPSLWKNIAQQLPASVPLSHGVESGAKGLLKTLGVKTIVTAVTAVVMITSAIVYYATKENPVSVVNKEIIPEQANNNNVIEKSTTPAISEVKENYNKKTPSGKNVESLISTNPVTDNNSTRNTILNDNVIQQLKETDSPENTQSSKNTNSTVAEKQTQANTDHSKKENSPELNSNTSPAKSQTTKPEVSECDKLKKNLPNTFSPNGDGKNDTFYLPGLDEKITTLKVGIYQMGKLVYEWEGVNGSWDGSMKDGNPASVGDYVCVYIFETKSGESCSGFTPVRIFR